MKSKSDPYTKLYYLAFSFVTIETARLYSLLSIFHYTAFLINLMAIVLSGLTFVMCLQRFKSREMIFVLLISLLVVIVGLLSDQLSILLLSYVIIIGAKDIPFKNIVKLHFILTLIFCLTNIVGSQMGMTMEENFSVSAMQREDMFGDTVERENFGYLWVTDFATHVFFILLDYWILRNARLNWIEYLSYLFICFLLFIYCDSRLAIICTLLILLASLYMFIKRKRAKQPGFVIRYSFLFSIPIFAVVSLIASYMYDESDLYWFGVNLILSNRLEFSQDAIDRFGFPLFGQNVEFYGHGNAGAGAKSYDYVDSSYLQYLIVWGIVLMCVIFFSFYRISKNAMKRKDLTLSIAVVLAGIAGVITQFLFYLGYCVLLVALLASHASFDDSGNILKTSRKVMSNYKNHGIK